MKVTKNTRTTNIGPAETFTGNVYLDPIRQPDDHSPLMAMHVRFAPGARTAWHTHPNGQTLYVTDGLGYVQRRGGQIEVIQPGDTATIEPGEEHWHGAAPDRFMAHVAMHEADKAGEVVSWLEHVTDAHYHQRPEAN